MTDMLAPPAELPVLTRADHAFFDAQGYVVIHDAVPPENCAAVVDAIWAFLEADRHDPAHWHNGPPRGRGMLEMYHHQSMWDNRQHPRIYQIFREILGTGRLWVTRDRVSMKPPWSAAHPEWETPGFIHWDVDFDNPGGLGVQGVLALTDTDADQGGFQCVPGSHHRFEELVATMTDEQRRRRCPDLTSLEVRPIETRAGDLVVWHRQTLHGNGENRSDRPRLAQYIAMVPARETDEAIWTESLDDRISAWREMRNPPRRGFPGDPRDWERQHYGPATLTPLGRRLLGIDPWPPEVE